MRAWRAWVVFTSFAAGGMAGAEALAARAEKLGAHAERTSQRADELAAGVARLQRSLRRAQLLVDATADVRDTVRAVLALGRSGACREPGLAAGEQPPRSPAGIGRANRKPCARSQPSSRTEASWPSDSMPSASRDEAERVGEAGEVGGDRRVLGVVLDALDEGAVDLDHVDREAAQLPERREAGAEVVDRDRARRASCSSLSSAPGALARCALDDDRRLGDLEAEALVGERPVSAGASRRTSSRTPPAESCLPDTLTQVDERVGQEPSPAPTRPSAGRPRASTNSPSGMIRPVASATGMKRSGGTRPRVGECQRSSASTPTIASAAEVDRAAGSGRLNSPRWRPSRSSCSSPSSSPSSRAISSLEHLVAAAAGLLGGVHRDVGVPDQLVARARAAAVSDDADAGAERELAVRRSSTGSDRRSSSRSASAIATRLVRALEQQRELVAAEPGERVARRG